MRMKLLAASCAAAALLPALAFAQTAPAAAEQAAQSTEPQRPGAETNAEGTQVGEVIVTARRRAEELRDVPIAVTALSGDQLQRQQVYQVREIANFTPGLNINSDGVGRAFVSIRGVGTTLIDTVQPGVGIFIDGIYQPNTSYLNSPLVDVERIEVLRGPQGTLFGNNTLGGAINVITRQPNDTFTARANAVIAGDDDFRALSASASGPVVEGMLQARFGVAYSQRDGFLTNTITGSDLNPLTQESANGTIRFAPTPAAVFTLNFNGDRVIGANTPYVEVTGPSDVRYYGALNVNNRADISYTGVNLRGDFNLADWNTTLTAVAAYNERTQSASGDGDFGPVDFARTTAFSRLETTTGELRADTRWSDRISTLIGVFVSRYTVDANGTTRIVPASLTVPNAATTESNSQAVFGTVFIDLSARTHLAVGLRYDHQDLDSSQFTTAATYEADELQPRITLNHELTDDWTVYGSIARGFRGGGQNGPGAPNLIYEGDSVWTYEVGSKFRTADRRLTLDTALFYNDYSNFIGQNSLAPSTSGAGFVAINLNTGDVRSYGFEAEAVWRPDEHWRINGTLTLLNARITDDTPYFRTTGTHVSNDRLIFTPDYNYSLGASYTLPMTDGSAWVAEATLIGKGSRPGSSLDPAVSPILPAYEIVNASLTYRLANGLDLSVFSTNLLDEEYLESYIDRSALVRAGLAALARNLGFPGERRRVGLRLNYRY